jgi:hypothetical protein
MSARFPVMPGPTHTSEVGINQSTAAPITTPATAHTNAFHQFRRLLVIIAVPPKKFAHPMLAAKVFHRLAIAEKS